MPKRQRTPELADSRDESRLVDRGGQAVANAQFYNESRQNSKMSRAQLMRGCNINQAQYDEIEYHGTQWLFENHAYHLDFSKDQNFGVRGMLEDSIEDIFAHTISRHIPRHWRNNALHSLINIMRSQFTTRPELADPTSCMPEIVTNKKTLALKLKAPTLCNYNT